MSEIPTSAEKAAVRRACRRDLVLHRTPTPAEWLTRLAASEYAKLDSDVYAEGGAVGLLETRVAGLLGTEAAAFFTEGVAAQLAALKVWMQRTGGDRIALHPLSHLDLDEDDAPARIIGATPLRLGADAPFTAAELEALPAPPHVVAYEAAAPQGGLPRAELGGAPRFVSLEPGPVDSLPSGRGAPVGDGAAYARPLAEIAGLADSVYVSLYKGLGALSGAVLAGPADVVAEARRWRLRLGAQPYRNFAGAISALEGLDRHLPARGRYLARARTLAEALRPAGVAIHPDPPMCTAFRLRFPAAPERLEAAHLALAQATGVWWFNVFRPDGEGAYAEIMLGVGFGTGGLKAQELQPPRRRAAAGSELGPQGVNEVGLLIVTGEPSGPSVTPPGENMPP